MELSVAVMMLNLGLNECSRFSALDAYRAHPQSRGRESPPLSSSQPRRLHPYSSPRSPT
jgi:hypothetical protein